MTTNHENSDAFLARAYRAIPSATQTFSKGPNQWIRGVSPAFLERGDGAWVWDVDGNKYLDYLMALGPIILGYGNEAVVQAVADRFRAGPVMSQMHPLEVEVAEMIIDRIPYAEMVRFGKNGSDATTAAIRVARAFTGRDHVVYCGYHGWHDWYIGSTTRAGGVPESVKALTSTFTYTDLASLQAALDAHAGNVAAVIMEPVGITIPEAGFLDGVRELTHKAGALLVFDEIVNGFRMGFAGGGASQGVTPDLGCFGKAMANGAPISAVVGRRDVMNVFDEIFFSGTFGGDTCALAACKATIGELERLDVFAHLQSYGARLSNAIQEMISSHGLNGALDLVGYPERSILPFPHSDEYQSRLRRSYFMQECHKRGLLFFGVQLPTASHGDEELAFTLSVYEDVLPLFSAAYQADDFEQRMDGAVTEPIFRKP